MSSLDPSWKKLIKLHASSSDHQLPTDQPALLGVYGKHKPVLSDPANFSVQNRVILQRCTRWYGNKLSTELLKHYQAGLPEWVEIDKGELNDCFFDFKRLVADIEKAVEKLFPGDGSAGSAAHAKNLSTLTGPETDNVYALLNKCISSRPGQEHKTEFFVALKQMLGEVALAAGAPKTPIMKKAAGNKKQHIKKAVGNKNAGRGKGAGAAKKAGASKKAGGKK